MARTIAALMRHGHYHQPEHTPSAHLPYTLTERGREQAASAADDVLETARRQGWSLDPVIETSHLLRAWETGRIIRGRWLEMEAREFAVQSFEDLSERSVGSAANLTEAQITAIVEADPRYELPPNWRLDSVLRLPFSGAESLMDAGRRVLRHLDHRFGELADSTSADTVRLVVGHGGSIRHAAIHMGILRLEDVLGLSMRNCGVVYFERFPDGTWKHVLGEWKIRDRSPAVDWAPRD
ncbi:MAG: histidine phosphatase family protein [Candidatus Eisenbacteria bacterium]